MVKSIELSKKRGGNNNLMMGWLEQMSEEREVSAELDKTFFYERYRLATS